MRSSRPSRTPAILLCLLSLVLLSGCNRSGSSLTNGEPVDQEASQARGAATAAHVFDPGDRWDLASSPVRGSTDAYVTIVEWGSYACSFCARVQPTLTALLEHEELGPRLRVVFKQHPLDSQQRARPAARAALAAHRQGAFWEMHDLIYAAPNALSEADFIRYAQSIDLDIATFRSDMADPHLNEWIDRDIQLARSLRLSGTPNFMINGRNLVGAQSEARFESMIREEVNAVEELLRSGLSLSDAYAARLDENAGPVATVAIPSAGGREPPRLPAAEPDPDANLYVPVDDAPSRGGTEPLVTMVMFFEFECPFSDRARATVEELLREYGDDLRLVVRHRPLDFHTRSEPAAIAAEAARRQDAFWPYFDLLFDRGRHNLSDEELVQAARLAGLDVERFRRDVASDAVRAAVARDVELADRLAARGTPHFFINGIRLRGAQPAPVIRAAIDRQLVIAQELVASGVPRSEIYDTLQREAIRGPAPMLEDVRAVRTVAPHRHQETPRFDIAIEGAPALGPADAPVTIVEFSDFTCGYCGRFHGALMDLVVSDAMQGRVRVVFKHFPRTDPELAVASMAAHEQGKFWEFAHVVFSQGARSEEAILAIARGLDLDLEQFNADRAREDLRARVAADREEGTRLGVRGTPTWYVNGERHVGNVEGAGLRSIVSAALERATAD